MNIMAKLTLRHLRANKRRTLVTIIGVIISAAMITAVATIGVSFMDLLQRVEIADNGEWHVRYPNVTKEQLEAIREDEATRALVVSRHLGYAMLEGSMNEYKPYWFIQAYNEEGFKHFPVKLVEGRLPQSPEELVISENMLTNAKVQLDIGQTLTLEIGERIALNADGSAKMDIATGREMVLGQNNTIWIEDGEVRETLRNTVTRTFTIVGIIERPSWEPSWSPGYTALTYVDTELLGPGETAHGSVLVKKLNQKLFKHAEQLAEELGIEQVQFNSSLLRFYGVVKSDGIRKTIYSLIAIIMSVIVIGSVALIYNAFAISVSERSRQLGMMASVGATRRQKRYSVLFEGMVIGAVSIPLGIAAGLVGIGVTFAFISDILQSSFGVEEPLKAVVTPMSILLSCLVSIMTILVSTFIPARRASRISAIDAIRQTMDIKLTRRMVKTSPLVRWLFGIEAEIGLKNLKRHKRRYMATVFSLVISIVLFLSVSFFTQNLVKSVSMTTHGVNYDIQVYTYDDKPLKQEFVDAIVALEEVTAYNHMTEANGIRTWLDKDQLAEPLRKQVEEGQIGLEDRRMEYGVVVYALDDDVLAGYARQIGADPNRLLAEGTEATPVIVIDGLKYRDDHQDKYVETKAIHTKVGERLKLHLTDWVMAEGEDENDPNREMVLVETPLDEVEVAALTDQLPMGAYPLYLGQVGIVVPKRVLEGWLDAADGGRIWTYSRLYLTSSDPSKTQEEIENMDYMDRLSYSVQNVHQSRKQDKQMILILSVFTYGFIALITLISIANILNTITTSIALRKREFAMLKSIGMTPQGFGKMIRYESIFYGIKALLYGLPLSFGVMLLIYNTLENTFDYEFTVPWGSILIAVLAVFVIVGTAMMYSSAKVRKENIIDAIKQEVI